MNPNLPRIYVVPKKGIVVVDLETNRPIPAEGALVLDSRYMRRRIRQGDVTETAVPDPSNTAKKTQKKEG
ncbi:DUF2635 domain-containing protein [Micavibrio aeruginosavorus]|uniref:DUF2635 domain-containing protein n=1 Tax=Micavibrio aeruginosavorus TaxID=349221 RepID=UPI003F4AABC4